MTHVERKTILLHNAREALEYAATVLEWLWCDDPLTDERLRKCLLKDGSIAGDEEHATGKQAENSALPDESREERLLVVTA